MKSEFVDLIGKEHTLRVLFALRARGPARFRDLEQGLKINPAQLDRALTWLRERFYVLAKTVPAKSGPVVVNYEASKRALAFLAAFDSFVEEAEHRRGVLGEDSVRDLAALAG